MSDQERPQKKQSVKDARKDRIRQRILQLQQQLSSLDSKNEPLSSKSEGFPEMLAKFNHVMNTHNVSAADVITVLLKAKRTGLALAPRRSSAQDQE